MYIAKALFFAGQSIKKKRSTHDWEEKQALLTTETWKPVNQKFEIDKD